MARAIVGFIATAVVVAMFWEPQWRWRPFLVALAIAILCVATARNRLGVLLGIAGILASRLVIAGIFSALRLVLQR